MSDFLVTLATDDEINLTLQTSEEINITLATAAIGPAGPDGLSAYQVAVANGFVGSESAWLASLVIYIGEIDGGTPSSVYGGNNPINGGTP